MVPDGAGTPGIGVQAQGRRGALQVEPDGAGTPGSGVQAPGNRRCSAPRPGSGARSDSGHGLAPPTGRAGPPPRGCW